MAGVQIKLSSYNYVRLMDVNTLLMTITVILLVLWMIGMVTSYTMGGFIHILLALALVAVMIRLVRGEKIY